LVGAKAKKFSTHTGGALMRGAPVIELSYGEFTRSFTLPGFVDTNKVNAEFKDGILRVMLAKREEAKPKNVEVKVK